MISSRLHARWRTLATVLDLDLLSVQPDRRAQATRAAAASAAADDKQVVERSNTTPVSGGAR